MLPTEAINRIQVLSERGMGSKAIAKSTGISRNTVRKYLSVKRQPDGPTNRHKNDPLVRVGYLLQETA